MLLMKIAIIICTVFSGVSLYSYAMRTNMKSILILVDKQRFHKVATSTTTATTIITSATALSISPSYKNTKIFRFDNILDKFVIVKIPFCNRCHSFSVFLFLSHLGMYHSHYSKIRTSKQMKEWNKTLEQLKQNCLNV